MKRKTIQQVAFDSGYGRRCVSHAKDNPYHEKNSPSLWDAWERGWAKADKEANA